MSNREAARLAWRKRVTEAARAFGSLPRSRWHTGAVVVRVWPDTGSGAMRQLSWKPRSDLDDALAAPKPWVSGGQRPQPVRHSRAKRKRGRSWPNHRRPVRGCWCWPCVAHFCPAPAMWPVRRPDRVQPFF